VSARPSGMRALLSCLALALAGCEALEWQALRLYLAANHHLEVADGPVPYRAETEDLWLVPIVDGLEFPWDMTFVSPGEVLVTEKPGRLSRIDLATGEIHPVAGVPEVAFVGQGGLLGVECDPAFGKNGWVYLSYSIPVPPDAYTTRVARAQLRGDRLEDLEVLLTAQPARPGINHFGGALAFDRRGLLYVSIGEREERDFAQDLGCDLGKVLRIRPDGSIPEDNPFVGRPGARSEIFSWGHRNPQGLALHPQTGEMWESEHGPQGGDEINVLRPGRNYGWPIITYGEEYGGGKIGVGTHRDGLEQPVHYYVPSIAPSGIAFSSGDSLASWRGDLLVAALRLTHLNRLSLEGERVVHEERLFADLWHRVRSVAESPFTRQLFVLTENGTLFRIDPRQAGDGRGRASTPRRTMSSRKSWTSSARRAGSTSGWRARSASTISRPERLPSHRARISRPLPESFTARSGSTTIGSGSSRRAWAPGEKAGAAQAASIASSRLHRISHLRSSAAAQQSWSAASRAWASTKASPFRASLGAWTVRERK